MVDDSLIFMDLDPDVCICLTGNSTWFNKASSLLVHIVATLSSGNVMRPICIQSFLPSSHGLVVEFTTLFLQLIVTNVKSIPTKAMIAHSHLI